MERSEPSLVPEWLRSTGNISGGGSLTNHCVSAAHSPRNGCSRVGGDKNSHRGSVLDRSYSGNSRYSLSNNGSSKHPYSSFNRNPRDRNRDKEKDKSATKDLWELSNFDPLRDILTNKTDKDKLRRTSSLLCRKPSDSLPKKAADVKTNGNNNQSSNNGVPSGGIRGIGFQGVAFDKDFPSLGVEEKHGGVDGRRVPSPGMNTAMQSLIGGEGWTSALAEVPMLIGSNLRPISVQHVVTANASTTVSSPLAGPNMAETLSQGPPRARTSQLPERTQMLEELAIKQSKQLIPMTPSMPKALVHNSDKLKLKTSLRTGESGGAAKSVQQQQPHSTQLTNRSVRGGHVGSVVTSTKSSNGGKFLVLKPVRDNGVLVAKDVDGATNNANNGATIPLAGASEAASNVKSPHSSKQSNLEGKVSVLSLNTGPFGEKRPSLSQVQSRSEFFKLMRKKSSTSASASSALVESSAEVAEGAGGSVTSCMAENEKKVFGNENSHEEEKNLCLNGTVYPDEEEAAFLRSLGWDENAGEDDCLTEEEINAFYEEYMKMKPSLKLCKDVEQKITSLCETHTTGSSRASSELSFSETEAEA